MSFERTGYDGRAPWDFTTRGKSQSEFDNDQHYLILIKRIHEYRVKSAQSGASIFKPGGHQPKDMRDSLTRARDAMQDRFRPAHSLQKQTPAVAVKSSSTLYEAFNLITDAFDFVVFKAELAARSLKLNPIKLLGRAGMVTRADWDLFLVLLRHIRTVLWKILS